MDRITWNIERLQCVPSTNTYLDQADALRNLPQGWVVTAHSQPAGRGQLGNSWESAPGENLTFSYLLRPVGIAAQQQFRLSQAAALAVTDVLQRYGNGFTVKWPNDIYHDDKKIAGILIEHQLAGSAIGRTIVGIGLNVNQEQFVSDAPNPVALTHITGCRHDTDELLQQLLDATAQRYAQCIDDPQALHRDYMATLYRREGYYPYSDSRGEFAACIEDVEPGGMLVLRDSEGELRRYAFKEVSFVL